MRIKNREQWYLLKKSQILKRALFTLVLTFYITFLRDYLNTKMTFDRFFSHPITETIKHLLPVS